MAFFTGCPSSCGRCQKTEREFWFCNSNITAFTHNKPRHAGSQDVVELLLAAGADPTQAAAGGATALHAAAASGSLSAVLALLQVAQALYCKACIHMRAVSHRRSLVAGLIQVPPT